MTELLENLENENNYDDLIVSIQANYQQLNLLIAVCDDSEYRDQIIQKYETELSPDLPCYRVQIPRGEPSLRAALASVVENDEYLQAGNQAVITVTGVDGLGFLTFDKEGKEKSEQDKFLGYLQWTREALRHFPFSIVLWMTLQMERSMSKRAPDFRAWCKGVFRFVSFPKKALPKQDIDFLRPVLGDLRPVLLERWDEVDDDDPHFLPVADLQELISDIEREKGEKDVSLVTLYGSLGKIFARRVERGEYENYQEETELAIKYFQKAIALQQELGLEEGLARNLNNLAALYYSQGKYDAAELLFKQVIEIDKIALPENHPSLATELNNLALLYESQGKYEAAEPLLKQAIEIYKIALPENHPDFATLLSNLAELYRSQGKYKAAETLFKQAIEIIKVTLPHNNPDLATFLNNLATLYYSQGRYEAAEPLFKEAVEVFKVTLPPNHPYVAALLSNLAQLYHSQGKYEAAEPLFKQAIEIIKVTLPPNHPDLATLLNNQALLYHSQEKYEAAELLLKQAIEIIKVTLPANHPQRAIQLKNLAGLYYYQGKHEAAELLYKQSIQIDKITLLENHPDFATHLNNLALLYNSLILLYSYLALLYSSQGKYEAAELLYKVVLDMFEQTLGEEHPDTQTVRENLELFRQQQKSKTGILSRMYGWWKRITDNLSI
ncbi:MAG: tetratricopeptide repeat protein [Cyanobacteria bacterium P01_H01_bin.35]